MKKPGKNSLSKGILNYLSETSKDLFDVGIKIIFNPYEITKGMGIYNDKISSFPHFSRNVSNLKKSPYFNFQNNTFYLTHKGRIEIIRTIIKEKKNKKIKWDGRWRAIIFDIPELNRRERAFLRNELKWMGFQELQKSIWIFPYDIEKELFLLLKLWRIDFKGDIRFLRIEKINDDQDMRKCFDLE